MHTFEAPLSVPNAQRHGEVALSLAQATNASVALAAPDLVPTTVKPVGWADVSADWLDTPADHCSPLDDY